MPTRTPLGHDLMERLAALDAIDAPAKKLAKVVRDITKPQAIKDALSGTWLGHPVHPLLVLVPMGTWTSAVLLDLVGGEDAESAADGLIGVGLLSALPTVATGYSDWADTEIMSDPVRRIGAVHAALNATSAVLLAVSLGFRARGSRTTGKLLALTAWSAMGASGYLGGHLTYAEGVGVDVTTFEEYPEDWTEALADAALGEGEMRAVEIGGTSILIARSGGEVFALSNTCVHRGGPLDQGELSDGCVSCPWHDSIFRLENGSVEKGPAAYPQPALEARVRDGSIEVRAPQGS